jgi:hypothetical protein
VLEHISHKVKAEFDEERGWAASPDGSLRMHTGGGRLQIEAEAADAAALERLKAVVDAHIVRFAFQEKLEPGLAGGVRARRRRLSAQSVSYHGRPACVARWVFGTGPGMTNGKASRRSTSWS